MDMLTKIRNKYNEIKTNVSIFWGEILDIYDPRVRRKISTRIAFLETTKGMSFHDIYKQNGELRASVRKKIDSRAYYYNTVFELNFTVFIERLINLGMVDENNMILGRDIDKICNLFCDFWRDKNKNDLTTLGVSPETFFIIKDSLRGEVSGVYIIYNQDKQMYYVGQATRIFFRINQHFTGHGNGDIYADYKYGDRFLIKYITLNGSDYESLDALEKAKIAEYDAYNTGYNKTNGNG